MVNAHPLNCETFLANFEPISTYYIQSVHVPLRISLNFSCDIVKVTGVVSLVTGLVLWSCKATDGSPISCGMSNIIIHTCIYIHTYIHTCIYIHTHTLGPQWVNNVMQVMKCTSYCSTVQYSIKCVQFERPLE